MAYSVTLIPGDGIGPEVADAAVRAVDATASVSSGTGRS
jgi:isocitrate/isopropylmalate dehydrogenase